METENATQTAKELFCAKLDILDNLTKTTAAGNTPLRHFGESRALRMADAAFWLDNERRKFYQRNPHLGG